MNDKFSIIIPTMWRSELIHKMLPKYEKSRYVGEVIIIDNDPLITPRLNQYSKVRIYTKGENIYVNPAWNWGVSLAKYRIILANDDIFIENIDRILVATIDAPYDIIGRARYSDKSEPLIKPVDRFPARYYGCFMYVRNYVPIPDEIKIWIGDDLLFYWSERRGVYKNFGIKTEGSATVNSDESFRNKIGRNDRYAYKKLFEEGKVPKI